MKKSIYALSNLKGAPVYDARKPSKRIGKVHSFIFHPHKRRVIGFTVKRPDVMLMAHRSDIFVAFDAFDVDDGHILISDDSGSTGRAACKRLGVDWDECVIWQGLPLMTEAGERCGYVGDVRFRTEDGVVLSLLVDRGATADVLLGLTEIPADLIEGFKQGVGDKLITAEGDDFMHGAVIVSPEALKISAEGGLAQKAGEATAIAGDKASKVMEKAKPVASDVAKKTGYAVNKGAYAVGKQLSKTKGIFASFKEEYRRARDGEEDSK